jgi:tRNA(adenine34) deaminase
MYTDRPYLEMAMEEARCAYKDRTYPIGSVIVGPSGQIIGRGRNSVYSSGDFTSHAEVKAICAAGGQLMTWENFEFCTLYTTMEPCLMCCGAILLARIARVVWIRDDDMYGALRCLHDQTHPLSSVYVEKLRRLEITHCSECDLRQQMETWMETWNGQKEAVLAPWRLGNRREQSQNVLERGGADSLCVSEKQSVLASTRKEGGSQTGFGLHS